VRKPPTKLRPRSAERSKTDKSLSAERQKTDAAIKADRDDVERTAEGVIADARGLADAAVKVERVKADKESLLPPRPSKVGAVKGQRAKADQAVRGQRAGVDRALRSDLEGRAGALETLLVHEREATDAYLLTERVRSDDDVANRDDFLGMVAHDVRNLLNLVMLGLEGIRPPGEEEPPAYVSAGKHRIRRYVARMNRLIGDLVDVTSIDAGKLAVEPVEADAAALMAEATATFEPAALEKGISLTAEIPEGALLAVFDHDRMLQIFANLLSNSIKFTPTGGLIGVRVEPIRGALRFCVSDTGVGIAAGKLGAIFERFWQVGKDDRRGMGLGLYISKCIIDAHHGRIWAESEPSKGSEFYFTLPIPSSRRRRARRATAV
jgi:signal transduction histidine kinase